MMRILLVNKYFYRKGGAETYFFALAEGLKELGHEVAFFSMKHPNNEPSRWSKFFVSEKDYVGEISAFKKVQEASTLIYSFEAKRKFEALLEEFKPDIIHTNDWQTALVPVYYSTMYANREGYEGIKNIFTIHNIQYQGVYGKEILGDVFGLGEQHEQLLDFGGTMLVVSHDRYFINKLSTRVLSIGMNGAESFEGGYDDYAAKIAEQSAEKPKATKTMGKGGEDYKRRKERESELRRTITAIKKCEERINELDGLITKTNEEMSTPEAAADYARVMELTETLGKLNDEQTELMMQWEELENRKAQLDGEK